MRRFLLAVLSISILIPGGAGTAFAEGDEVFTLEDGDALEREMAALSILGGYPRSSLTFMAAPWEYVNLGFRAEAEYVPAFVTGVPLKAQMLESDSGKLNFALSMFPALYFNFDDEDIAVLADLKLGFASGWRFHRGNALFLAGDYALRFPVSHDADFSHYPAIAAGFEIPLHESINIILKSLVEFRDYEPGDFVYGGAAGLGFALW